MAVDASTAAGPCDALPALIGDCWPQQHGLVHVEVKNVTSLVTFQQGLARRAADLSIIQEHSCIPSKMVQLKRAYKESHGKILLAGPLDPNCTTPTGGMGAIACVEDTLMEVEPIAPTLASALSTGRVQLVAFGKGKGSDLVYFYNLPHPTFTPMAV
jgi:hypothetical protein